MIPETYSRVFDLLRTRTGSGDVLWKPTPDEDTFAVYLKEFSVTVRTYVRGGYNEPHQEVVRFEIINDNGEEIDSFEVTEDEPSYGAAVQLHASARRKAMRIDDAVSEILKELEAEGPVGEEKAPGSQASKSPFDEDDDLPF